MSVAIHSPSEEEGEQRPGKVQPLVAIVISVVKLSPAERGLQQTMHHVAGRRQGGSICFGFRKYIQGNVAIVYTERKSNK